MWEGLTWGMTRRQAAARLPAIREYTLALPHGRSAHVFGMPNYTVYGCPAKVALRFRKRRLNDINFDFELDDPKYWTCDTTVAADLRAAYGNPASLEVENGRLFRIQRGTWLAPNAQIYFHAITEVLADGHPTLLELSVTFLPRVTPPGGAISAGNNPATPALPVSTRRR